MRRSTRLSISRLSILRGHTKKSKWWWFLTKLFCWFVSLSDFYLAFFHSLDILQSFFNRFLFFSFKLFLFYSHSMLWRWPCDYKHTDNWIIIRFCWFLYLQPDFHKRLPRSVVHRNMRPNTSTDIPLSSEVDKLTVDASTLTQRISITGAKTQEIPFEA